MEDKQTLESFDIRHLKWQVIQREEDMEDKQIFESFDTTEVKKMTKQELLEHVRSIQMKLGDEAEWYYIHHCNQLFNLCMIKCRAYWDALEVIENAKDKTSLVETFLSIAYKKDDVMYLINKGLHRLAEFSEVKVQAHLDLYSLVVAIEDF